MKQIASFTVDHNKLTPGLYISRIDEDVVTYDLRTRTPNAGDYMDHSTMHSVEHLLATLLRNSPLEQHVIYFGPMGCQTGFYLLVRDVPPPTVVATLQNVLQQACCFEGDMPGNSATECGNFKTLSLDAARQECKAYYNIIKPLSTVMEYR